MKLYELIAALVQYGIDTGLTPACERIYTTNLLLDQFHDCLLYTSDAADDQ